MTNQTKNKRFFVSPWPFVVAAILFALVTPRLFSMYSVGHWNITQTAFHIEMESKNLKEIILPKLTDEKEREQATKYFINMEHNVGTLKGAGGRLMRFGADYHITGLISMMFTCFAFACKPRWVGLISLPFSLWAMPYFSIIM